MGTRTVGDGGRGEVIIIDLERSITAVKEEIFGLPLYVILLNGKRIHSIYNSDAFLCLNVGADGHNLAGPIIRKTYGDAKIPNIFYWVNNVVEAELCYESYIEYPGEFSKFKCFTMPKDELERGIFEHTICGVFK